MSGDDENGTLENIGPYEHWNFGDGKLYAFPELRQPYLYLTTLLHIFKRDSTDSIKLTLQQTQEQQDRWLSTLWTDCGKFIPSYYPLVAETKNFEDISPQNLFTILEDLSRIIIPKNFLLEQEFELRTRFNFPLHESAMHTNFVQDDLFGKRKEELPQNQENNKHNTVIVAVIDEGIPFAHLNFRDSDEKSSRIDYCWLQSATADRKIDKPTVLFGRELTGLQINDLIEKYGNDEDAIYRKGGGVTDSTGASGFMARGASHGAHVLDTAAGNKPDNTRIIAVQLPNTIGWDTSGFGKDMYILSAFHYIFERADRIASKLGVDKVPLVINFSFGFSGGGHDGNHDLERAFNEMVSYRRRHSPTALVVSSGNTFQSQMHCEVSEGDFEDNEFTVQWRIQPNDRTSSFLELWFPVGADADKYKIQASSPDFTSCTTLDVTQDTRRRGGDPSRIKRIKNEKMKIIGQISADKHLFKRWRVLIAIAPTEPEDSSSPAAASGVWQITIKRDETACPLSRPIMGWIQRDEERNKSRSGSKQSYFEDLNYREYEIDGSPAQSDTDESYVKRFGSMNGLATGSTTTVVAGYTEDVVVHNCPIPDNAPAEYSSAGSLNERGMFPNNVSCSAPSDRSKELPGVVGAGTRSGSYATLSGTSAAAPFVARQIAEAFLTKTPQEISNAKASNYVDLLEGINVDPGKVMLTARLGKKIVTR